MELKSHPLSGSRSWMSSDSYNNTKVKNTILVCQYIETYGGFQFLIYCFPSTTKTTHNVCVKDPLLMYWKEFVTWICLLSIRKSQWLKFSLCNIIKMINEIKAEI